MQDIRRPYSPSRSKKTLDARVEDFETGDYRDVDQHVNRIEEDRVKAFYKGERPHRPFSDIGRNEYLRKTRRRSVEMWLFTGVLVLLVLTWGLLTYAFDSATVTVTPKYSDLNTNTVITLDKAGIQGLPYVVATTSLSKSKELPRSDAKAVQSKASGKIIIYNNFDENEQRLVKNTRFESSQGKIYRINDSITVPGMSGGKPGSLEVTVYADSYGEDYNIPASDFTIPGFKGTPRYSKFYARGDGPISGGSSGSSKVVSASDLAAAKDELALSLTQDLKNTLKDKTMEGYINLSQVVAVSFEDNEKDILSGATSNYRVTATGYDLFIKEEDLARLLAKSNSQYNNEPLRIDNESTLKFSLRDHTDIIKDTKFDVLLEGAPRLVWKIDEGKIRLSLSGKKSDDFVPVMNSFPAVEKAEMKFFPIWLSTFPDSPEKINIIEKLPSLAKE